VKFKLSSEVFVGCRELENAVIEDSEKYNGQPTTRTDTLSVILSVT
jgi:hypothetical protein